MTNGEAQYRQASIFLSSKKFQNKPEESFIEYYKKIILTSFLIISRISSKHRKNRK